MRHCLYLLISSLCLYSGLFAQDDQKIKTDKPDQTDGTDIVDKKTLQSENQFYFNGFKEHGPSYILTSLWRYGISKDFEARVSFEQGKRGNEFITETAHSTYPLWIGFKWKIAEAGGWTPDLALVSYVQLPVTNSDSERSRWSPTFLLALQREIEKVTVTVNGGPGQLAYEKEWEWHLSGDLKYELNDRLNFFGEYYAHYQRHEQPMHNVDGGILYYFSNKVMAHFSAGTTIFHEPSYFFLSSGLSLRIF